MEIKKLAQEVFEIEAKEIANLSHRLTDDFEKSINAVRDLFDAAKKIDSSLNS